METIAVVVLFIILSAGVYIALGRKRFRGSGFDAVNNSNLLNETDPNRK